MLEKTFEYLGYTVEIHKNPVYYDFQFVVKKEGKVICASNDFYDEMQDAENAAQVAINDI